MLKDIVLFIPEGKTVALLRPFGGGKTTLSNLICRFFNPRDGAVKTGGADGKDISKKEPMDTVSFVFQNSRLMKASASILKNVG